MPNDVSDTHKLDAQTSALRSVLELNPQEITFLDLATHHVLWVNAAARANLGYPTHELSTLGPLGFISGLNYRELKLATESFLDGSAKTLSLQLAHTRYDGSDYAVESQLQLIELDDHQALAFFSIDITEKLELLSELESTRMFFKSAPDATVVVDENGMILRSNAQTERLLGWEESELVGEQIETLIPQRLHDAHVSHREGYIQTPFPRGMGADRILHAATRNGEEIPIEVSLSPMSSGSRTLVAAALRDMSERQAADAALRASESRYRELFNSANDLIQGFDRDGMLQFVNPAWLQKLGYTPDEVQRLRFTDIASPSSMPQVARLLEQLGNGESVNDIQLSCRTKNGTELYLEGSASTQINIEEQPSYRAIFHDVTQRIEYERSLRNARDLAEKATAGKTRFLAAASHDLRQPLQAMRLYLSVLERLTSEEKPAEVITKMESSVDTMSELLDALLDISRLDSGAIEPSTTDLSTDALLTNILASNEAQAKEKGVTLKMLGDSYRIHSDPGLLARIIDNFVTNAIRYTDQGEIALRADQTPKGIRLSVADPGIGIPEDQLDRVFEEYFQLNNSVRDRKKGLGLGLSIVKHISALLGHEVDVESAVGTGSTFSVVVPESEVRGSAPKVNSADAITSISTNIRVLFVDDDEPIVDATTMLLETAGIEVSSQLNAEAAIDWLSTEQPPDVLVTDFRLPEKSGVDIIRYAQDRYGPEFSSILMSGDTTIEALSKHDLQNCTLLRKPVETADLIQLIKDLALRTRSSILDAKASQTK